MSNKLTDEKLKELVREVLQEKYNKLPTDVTGYNKTDFIDDLFHTNKRKDAGKALSKKE